MDHIHVIRHKVLVEGKGIREVARETGFSRVTIRRYLGQAEPHRVEVGPRPRPVRERVEPRIEAILEEWEPRTTRKQRITATRVHKQLRAEGFAVGVTLVRDYLRERRRRLAEVYIPLDHPPGDSAQVDFFEVVVELDGERRKAWMFVVRLMFSGRDFAWIYDRCDQLSFLDGHVRAFAHFGAVPRRMVYDNLSPAVRRIVAPERELTVRFAALARHYLFEPCFARPGEGHDKGGVEGRGKGIRLQHLTPVPRGASVREMAAELLDALDHQAADERDREGRTRMERFAEERPLMIELADPAFEARRVVPVLISTRSQAQLEGATYSVPSHWARRDVTAYVGPDEVTFVSGGEEERYERLRFGQQRKRYRHYLPELATKPQAVRQVAAELIRELGDPFDRLWRLLVDAHGPREAARVFARVLGAVVQHGEATVAETIGQSIDLDALDQLALRLEVQPEPLMVEVPATLAGYEIESARASDFDALLGGDHE